MLNDMQVNKCLANAVTFKFAILHNIRFKLTGNRLHLV